MFKKKDNIVMRQIAGETFLIPIRDKLADMRNLFVLHGIGEFVWERLDGVNSLEDITRDVVSEYEVEDTEAKKDIAELLSDLNEAELVATA